MFKIIGLSFFLSIGFLFQAFAQQPMEAKDISLPLPSKEIWQNGVVNFGQCSFSPRYHSVTQDSEAHRNGLTISCLLTTKNNGIVSLWVDDISAQGQYTHNRSIPKPYHLLLSFTDGKTIFFKNRPNPASIVAINGQGNQLWEYLLKHQSLTAMVTQDISVIEVQDGFVIAYYDPKMPVKSLGTAENGYDDTHIQVMVEKIDSQGRIVYANSVPFLIDATTRVLKQAGRAIQIWPLQNGEYVISLQSHSLSKTNETNEQPHLTYQMIIFNPDGTHKSHFEVFLKGAATQGGPKLLIDRDGNFLSLNYGHPSTQSWLLPNQLQLSLYDQKGQKKWDYQIPVDQPKNGRAACLTWDMVLTPDNNYLVLCQQRFYINYWVRDTNYDKMWAIVLDKDGRELERLPILQDQLIKSVYKIISSDDNGYIITSSFLDNQLMISVNNYSNLVGNPPAVLTFEEWQKQQDQGKQATISAVLGTRLFVIPWPKN
ncbi:MAG: hypothetical protein IPP67_03140 [Rhodospirillaceae bacterium]|nr:hypothetical protein [Rhodospirillaceae bacterium]